MVSVTDYARFKNSWGRCLLPGAADNSEEVHQELLNLYNEPQRVYHTIGHIKHCLQMFDQVKHLVVNPDALEISIWFHDAIYDIGAHDNEQRSADLLLATTKNIFDDELCQLIYKNIMATLHADNLAAADDARYMIDIDLSSFGLPWDEFSHDSKKVRAERTDVSDKEAYAEQLKFKKSLLGSARFFLTDYFYKHYEAQAKENLSRYCKNMSQQLSES